MPCIVILDCAWLADPACGRDHNRAGGALKAFQRTATYMTTTVQTQIAEVQAQAARLTALLEIYPDLTFETNRWRRTFQCSKAVNAIATEYEINYSCGCCPDPALYVRVYVETPHGRVYGLPHQMEIGERDEIDLPIEGWDSMLRERGVQTGIIERLRAHFDNSNPTRTGLR